MKAHFRLLFLSLAIALFSGACSRLGLEADREDTPFFFYSWSKNLDPQYETGNLPIALNSPLIHDGIVYVGSGDTQFRAFQLDNGKQVWASLDNGEYHAGSLPFSKQVIYGTTQGRLYSRDLLTGEEKYSVDLGASVETTPVFHNGRLLLQTRDHRLVCLDAESGKILWAYKRSVPFLTTVQRASAPLVDQNRIYIGFADGSVVALNIEEGMVIWEHKAAEGSKFVDVDSTPVLFNRQLFVSTMAGHISVINPDTGVLIRKLPLISSRSPLIDGDRLVIGTIDGELIVFDKNFKQLFNAPVASGLISSIVVWKNSYILSSVKGELIAIDQRSFEKRADLHFGHTASAVFGQLQTDGTFLAVLTSRNRLHLFK